MVLLKLLTGVVQIQMMKGQILEEQIRENFVVLYQTSQTEGTRATDPLRKTSQETLQEVIEERADGDTRDTTDASRPTIKDSFELGALDSSELGAFYSLDELFPCSGGISEYLLPLYEENKEKLSFRSVDGTEEETEVWESTYSEMIDTEEAEETFLDAQYATVLGASTELSNREREKFDRWILFHSAEFGLIRALRSFTQDVNYAPWR